MNGGASRAQWSHWSRLIQADLLPAVISQADVETSQGSRITVDGKTPSELRNGRAGGFLDFTNPLRVTTTTSEHWQEGLHNCGMLCRRLRVIDVDISDKDLADEVYDFILTTLAPGDQDFALPLRDRPNTGKFALLYRLDDAPPSLGKGVVNVRDKAGAIEFLGDKQFFVLDGTHKTGVNYEWPAGRPFSLNDVPELRMDQLLALYTALQDRYSALESRRPWRYSTQQLAKSSDVDYQAIANDPAVKYLHDNHHIIGNREDGAVYVTCPWCDPATASTPIKHGDAMFIPAGVNAIGTAGFKCLHTHHPEMTASDYLEKVGYRQLEIVGEFPLIETSSEISGRMAAPADSRPQFTTMKDGTIYATLPNVVAMMQWTAGFGYVIRYDVFKDTIVYRHAEEQRWMQLTDNSFTELRLRAIMCGICDKLSADITRTAVEYVAWQGRIDSAQEWLNAQTWDGVPRVASFWATVMRQQPCPYLKASSEYLWTALAGRVIHPGVQVDIVPVLSGKQGQRKSTLIAMLTPSAAEYVSVSLSDRDSDLSRSLRGKLVADWAELRGIRSREADAIKGWITQTKDEWVPKFKEFSTTLPRRFVIIGSTNNARYLTDPTGHRRWLPLQVPSNVMLNTAYLAKWKEQLWAEAAVLFNKRGVIWQEAELLARTQHKRATVRDAWQIPVSKWLVDEPRTTVTITDALSLGVGLPLASMSPQAQARMAAVLASLDFMEDENGDWVKSDIENFV